MNAPAPVVPTPMIPVRLNIATADAVLVGSVVVFGMAAAFVGDSLLGIATPIVAGMLLLVSRRGLTQPSAHEADLAELPATLRHVVAETLAQLPDGSARRMLCDVIHPARALFATRESAFDVHDDDATRAHVFELVESACDIALDLARIDDAAPMVKSAQADLVQRYQSARALFEKRLGEAALALAALFASGVEHGTPASNRVAELVTVLHDEASVRSEAKAELDALLASDRDGATPGKT